MKSIYSVQSDRTDFSISRDSAIPLGNVTPFALSR
jgi:hypothetical protein